VAGAAKRLWGTWAGTFVTPFYRDIVDGLERSLDPEQLERCFADLLRRELFVFRESKLAQLQGACGRLVLRGRGF
jgi:hypothetical protein